MMYARHIQQWEYSKTNYYDYLIGVDDEIERRVKENCKIDYTTIYNYTNLKDLRKNNPLSMKVFDAAYIGGISEVRGALVIAEATRILKEEFSGIKIFLLGNIHDIRLRNYLADFIAKHDLKKIFLLKNMYPILKYLIIIIRLK
ncbi:hypothetical protein [Niabella ginsengisoli]|uniref:Glycosyltransferase n=1 Tax=Niabella ginsengisoli TaxID=522298 RepID=A0ABS9SLS4_9BACT|nr:hypothetical protein [Niabella ginsengisoli]MCH5599300.1 hypothetical protein [Niabella ginsengisoli]